MIRRPRGVNFALRKFRARRLPFLVPPWTLPGIMAAAPAERFRLALLNVILQRQERRAARLAIQAL